MKKHRMELRTATLFQRHGWRSQSQQVSASARHLTWILRLRRRGFPRHAGTGAFGLAPLHDSLLDVFLGQEVVAATERTVL